MEEDTVKRENLMRVYIIYVNFWAIVKANVINYSVHAFLKMSLAEMFLSDPHPNYISWFIKHVISITRVNRYTL